MAQLRGCQQRKERVRSHGAISIELQALEGEAVHDFSVLFAGDWFFATGERLEDERYFYFTKCEEDGGVQVVDSGPTSAIAPIKQTIFRMIMDANQSINTNPYS